MGRTGEVQLKLQFLAQVALSPFRLLPCSKDTALAKQVIESTYVFQWQTSIEMIKACRPCADSFQIEALIGPP
jgi:hypothetical protein